MADTPPNPSDRFISALARGLIGLSRLLPYRMRVPAVGWLVSRVIAPLAGWNARVRENLSLVHPEMPEAEKRRITRGVTNNAGRAVIETFSAEEFHAHCRKAPMLGDGVDTLLTACADQQPVLIVSGHIGNYDAISVVLQERGIDMGVLYRPLKNTLFDAQYVAALEHFAKPPFAADRKGITRMVRHLKDGRVVAMLLDVRRHGGETLTFMGHTALTSTSAAEWALKYDALLVPAHAIRQPDGLSFEVWVDPPVEHTGDVTQMTQALNDSLERHVRAHPEQWFWVPRRWRVT